MGINLDWRLSITCILLGAMTGCAQPAVAGALTQNPPPNGLADTPVPTLATPSKVPITPTAPTPYPTIESLPAMVNVDLLSCRYGPGEPYLFLYALRRGANIRLIGRTDGGNWNWVYVDGANKCWVNAKYLVSASGIAHLPVVYPGPARLPVSPTYPPTAVLHATRQANQVTIKWLDIPLRAGDEEDASMQHYIIEVWHCEGGVLLFEPLATNDTRLTLTDEPGCNRPSHGRIFVQEKHGLAGPTEIPWPRSN
jgi:hypothetical protein